MTDSIKEITAEIREFIHARGWAHNVADLRGMAISISLEAAELLEHFQWMNEGDTSESRVKENAQEISYELADVAIYTFQFADQMGIDLGEVIREKMRKNSEKYPI